MAAWITPKEGATRFRKLESEMDRQVLNAMRRGQHAIRKHAFALFVQRGIGRRIFAKKGSNTQQARVIIKRERLAREGSQYVLGLKFRGFAALVEQGGRTNAHEIPQGFGRAGSVRHPGSVIRPDPFFERAVWQAAPEIKAHVARGLERAAALSGLAA